MKTLFIIILSLFVILLAVYADFYLTFEGSMQSQSALYLNSDTDPNWISFSIDNKENADRTYVYEIYEKKLAEEQLKTAGTVTVQKDKTSLTCYPLSSKRVEKVRVRLLGIGQEVSLHTGYEYKEWKPEIVQDLQWEKQDPLVRNYYRYVQEVSKNYEYSR